MGCHLWGGTESDTTEVTAAAAAESWAFQVAQLVKNLPAMQETPVQFLGQEVPLEKG